MHGMNDKTLTLVRELGFRNYMGTNGRTEEYVFFLGPVLRDGREDGAHATEEAVLDFISYWENQIQVAKDYLRNGRNNKTHEWKKPNFEIRDTGFRRFKATVNGRPIGSSVLCADWNGAGVLLQLRTDGCPVGEDASISGWPGDHFVVSCKNLGDVHFDNEEEAIAGTSPTWLPLE